MWAPPGALGSLSLVCSLVLQASSCPQQCLGHSGYSVYVYWENASLRLSLHVHTPWLVHLCWQNPEHWSADPPCLFICTAHETLLLVTWIGNTIFIVYGCQIVYLQMVAFKCYGEKYPENWTVWPAVKQWRYFPGLARISRGHLAWLLLFFQCRHEAAAAQQGYWLA